MDPVQKLLTPVRALLKPAAKKPNTVASKKMFDAALLAAEPLAEARHAAGMRELLAIVGDRPDAPAPWKIAHARMLFELGDEPAFRSYLEDHFSGDEAVLKRFAGRAADRAIEEGAAGKARLSEAWHADFDATIAAFRGYEKGDDDASREAMKSIGAASPFAEWRLFLRGAIALANKDVARSEENFNRLDAERLPAKLAAPLRPRIAGVKPDPRVEIQRRELATPAAKSLLVASAAFARADPDSFAGLSKALKKAKEACLELRSIDPALEKRMRRWAYQAVIETGEEPDLEHYRAIFGGPPEDPKLDRLQAEMARQLAGPISAAPFWRKYAAFLASNNSFLPPAMRKAGEAAVLSVALTGCLDSIREKSRDPFSMMLMGIGRFAEPTIELANAISKACPDDPKCLALAFQGWQLAPTVGNWPAFDAALARFPAETDLLNSLLEYATKLKDYARRSRVLLAKAAHSPLDREARRMAAAGVLAELRDIRTIDTPRRAECIRYLSETAAPYPEIARVHEAIGELARDKAALARFDPLTPGLAFTIATEYSNAKLPKVTPKKGTLPVAKTILADASADPVKLESLRAVIQFYSELTHPVPATTMATQRRAIVKAIAAFAAAMPPAERADVYDRYEALDTDVADEIIKTWIKTSPKEPHAIARKWLLDIPLFEESRAKFMKAKADLIRSWVALRNDDTPAAKRVVAKLKAAVLAEPAFAYLIRASKPELLA